MEDEAILLKIRRDFTVNEAVQSLLKIISSLEFEIGMLKSDLAEARFKIHKLETNEKKTKKEWLKDDLIGLMDEQLKQKTKKVTELSKSVNDWRNKYFSLMASKS